jgi:hypothetical protein
METRPKGASWRIEHTTTGVLFGGPPVLVNQMIAFSIDQCTKEKWSSHLTPEQKRLVEEHVKQWRPQRLKECKQEEIMK